MSKKLLEAALNAKVEYIFYEGRKYLALYQSPHEKGRTAICAFCGERHTHGIGFGHRVPHCVEVLRPEVTAADGSVLRKKDGYFVITT